MLIFIENYIKIFLEFSSIDKAMGSLLFGVLGDGVDFREISKANRLLAPAFHFLFTFVVSILFFSLFITMVDEAYTQVKEEQAKGRSGKKFLAYFAR